MYDVKPFSRENFKYIKGIAILAVLVSHIGNYSGKTWFTPLGGIGVAIFLFCSGYGLMASYHKKGLKQFWLNKFFSIYCPFAVVEIIAAIINHHSIWDLFLDLMFIKIFNPLGWYMQYLAVSYFAFYIVVRFIPNVKLRFAIWGTIELLSFVLLPNLQAEQALSYISGLFLAEIYHDKNLTFERRKTLILGVISLLLSMGFLATKQLPVVRNSTHYLITALNLMLKSMAAIGVICICSASKPVKKIIFWISGLSYALYLVHGYFLWIVAKRTFGNFFISAVAMLIISFVIALILNELVKRLVKWKEKKYDAKGISNKQ